LKLIKEGKLQLTEPKEPLTVTFHDGCDLGRNGGVYDEPREILKMLPGITFIEHPESKDISRCCGSGGDLLMTNPDMADKIGQKRAKSLSEVASVVVTCCPSCRKQLKDTAKRAEVKLDSADLLEMIVAQLPKPEKPEEPKA
jgi:Fe-S oxidoreductase